MIRSLEFASHPSNLALVRDFVRAFLQPWNFSESDESLMVLGLDEACTNVIRYAYDHAPDGLMGLTCESTDAVVRFRLRDYGKQADPALLQGRDLDEIRPGGLGVHLIRMAFDRVDYSLCERGTELILEKQRPREGEFPHGGDFQGSGG